MTLVLRTDALTKSFGRKPALIGLHAGRARRPRRRPRRPQRRGQEHAAEPRRRDAGADLGRDRGARRDAAYLGDAEVGFVAQDTPTYATLSVDDHLHSART